MDEQTIDLNPDPLAEFESILRDTGAWCGVYGESGAEHYFVARNKSLNTAVALCGSRVVTFDKIYRHDPAVKCLSCCLFEVGRKEVIIEKRKNEAQGITPRKGKKKPKQETLF